MGVTLVAMAWLSWQLTLVSLAVLPFFLWLTHRVGKVRRGISTETQKSLADVTAITEETLSVSGILLSKTFGQQEAVRRSLPRRQRQAGRHCPSARAWSVAGSS